MGLHLAVMAIPTQLLATLHTEAIAALAAPGVKQQSAEALSEQTHLATLGQIATGTNSINIDVTSRDVNLNWLASCEALNGNSRN